MSLKAASRDVLAHFITEQETKILKLRKQINELE